MLYNSGREIRGGRVVPRRGVAARVAGAGPRVARRGARPHRRRALAAAARAPLPALSAHLTTQRNDSIFNSLLII